MGVWLDRRPADVVNEVISPESSEIDKATYVGQQLLVHCTNGDDGVDPDRAADLVIGVQPDLD